MNNSEHDYLPFVKQKTDSLINNLHDILNKTDDLTVASIMLRGLSSLNKRITTYIIDEQLRELNR